jgi:hypothetical protein
MKSAGLEAIVIGFGKSENFRNANIFGQMRSSRNLHKLG